MVNLSFIPSWFFGYGVILELAFAIITLAVSLYSFKIYRMSDQEQSRLFGISFLLFSISYFIQSALNFAILSEFNERFFSIVDLQKVLTLDNLSIFVHMILFTLGLVTLTYMIIEKKKKWIYPTMIGIAMLFLIFSVNKVQLFYVLSSFLLIFILAHYIGNYTKNKKGKTLLVLIAFAFLLLGHLHFILLAQHSLFYVIGNFLELIAYILILINLLRILKK